MSNASEDVMRKNRKIMLSSSRSVPSMKATLLLGSYTAA